MVTQSHSISIFTLFPLLIISLIGTGEFCVAYTNPGSLGNKDHAGSDFLSDDHVTSFNGKSNLDLCNIQRHVIDVQLDRKKDPIRVPIMYLGNPSYVADRYYFPTSARLKSKKSQRAILVDVGDFIIRSDGRTQVVADIAATQTDTGHVGGILRNNG